MVKFCLEVQVLTPSGEGTYLLCNPPKFVASGYWV